MKRTNWLDLFQKLVDPYDMADAMDFIQKAIGDGLLAMCGAGVQITPDFPTPFPITMSGSTLGGTVGTGTGLDDNGQLVIVPTGGNAFALTAAHATLARWDLLVLKFSPTPDTPIPKPTDGLVTVYQYLLDGYQFAVRAGTASGSPAYPTKTPGDIIISGIKVPALATLGTSCTLDSTVQEQGFIPTAKFGLDISLFNFNKSRSAQTYLSLLDAFLLAGAADVSDDGINHDYAEVTCNNGGTAGHTLTLGATTFTLGTGAGQIPVAGDAPGLAKAIARAIREDGVVGLTHFAAAAYDGRVGITAKATGAVGTALSRVGGSFTVSAANLAGNGARTYASGATVKKQIGQLDTQVAANSIGLPFGVAFPAFTETVPTGFLEANGQSVLRATYPLLFAVIGTTFGTADGTHFNLPDTRGYFLRGWAHGQTTDPDKAGRTAPAATGATGAGGDHVGTTQVDDFKSHTHQLVTGSGGGNPTSAEDARHDRSDVTGATGGNETRPLNINVMWIMRAG